MTLREDIERAYPNPEYQPRWKDLALVCEKINKQKLHLFGVQVTRLRACKKQDDYVMLLPKLAHLLGNERSSKEIQDILKWYIDNISLDDFLEDWREISRLLS
jgi:hypothetical protein